ncbi:hypothetical protein TrCOL_g3857 [Triparma columacea]|uniref:Inositol 1,3,4-trisphosphate 5/6-kinase ATP-grasp domain-containing protein n=1 Tax=Triparma columacea TaxID=722753 RepID=A0A9W7GEH3_9STRA|nr:hypothetical protein TrCOL_g3857 [Triparma columacea]
MAVSDFSPASAATPSPPDASQDTIVVGYVFGPKKMKTMGSVMIQTAEATARVATNYGCDVSIISADSSAMDVTAHTEITSSMTTAALPLPHTSPSPPPAPPPPTPFYFHHFPPKSVTTSSLYNPHHFVDNSDTASTQSSSASSTGCCSSSLGSSISIMDVTPQVGPGIQKVKFVPLNLDLPLEDQHGGRFDCILHKLTEDLLLVSNSPVPPPPHVLKSIQRLERLEVYCAHNDKCNLICPPRNVRKLMSRASIARILADSLRLVRAPGLHFSAPLDAVVRTPSDVEAFKVREGSKLSYPLIAKPLDAAGTASSHKMTVVLRDEGLESLTLPCLLQEYENHGGVLFKVYVLGGNVRVFSRPSLPDLRAGRIYERDRVDFDSQKPYPGIEDFGGEEGKGEGGGGAGDGEGGEVPRMLTIEEVKPIADDIRKTFGLDLFGFDVLVRSCGSRSSPPSSLPPLSGGGEGGKELVVVDVNYFPSYKEMYEDFPAMLAEFLVAKAIEGEKKNGEN